MLAAVLDCLVPGDGDFPCASATGAPDDVVAHAGEDAGAWLRPGLAALDAAAGGDFLGLDGAARIDALARVEREDGDFFDALLELAYYCYYMQPPVVDAIRRMGTEYNLTPQPGGYRVEAFDPADPETMPARPCGSYKRTEDIAREAPR